MGRKSRSIQSSTHAPRLIPAKRTLLHQHRPSLFPAQAFDTIQRLCCSSLSSPSLRTLRRAHKQFWASKCCYIRVTPRPQGASHCSYDFLKPRLTGEAAAANTLRQVVTQECAGDKEPTVIFETRGTHSSLVGQAPFGLAWIRPHPSNRWRSAPLPGGGYPIAGRRPSGGRTGQAIWYKR